MSLTKTDLIVLFLLPSCALAMRFIIQHRRKPPLPPGPPSVMPIIGNIKHIPSKNAWIRYTETKDRYGKLTMFHGLGNHILVLNTEEAIRELFEKRYKIYSNRPQSTLLGKLAGASRQLMFMNYGNKWRDQRKVAHAALCSDAVTGYEALLEDVALNFCKAVTQSSENFSAKLRLGTSRIVFNTMYGIDVKSEDNEYMHYSEKVRNFIAQNSRPGKHLCDLFPFMVHLPSWLPFHRLGREGREIFDHFAYAPFEYVKQQMAAGTALPSVSQRLLEEYRDKMTSDWEDSIRFATATMHGAGAGTTRYTVLTFILAMLLHPKKQAKAQAEVDTIIGVDRLPSLSEDFGKLPYVNAIIKETMRWHPVAPLGVPRCAKEEDVYDGYRIPKGTTVIPNVWALTREPNFKYPPGDFIPERFLDPTQPTLDPSTYLFGFGRRVCPGKMLAEQAVFIFVCHILALFDLEQILGEPPSPSFGSVGLTIAPSPFACRFRPRRQFSY